MIISCGLCEKEIHSSDGFYSRDKNLWHSRCYRIKFLEQKKPAKRRRLKIAA
jgi:hypothetical protein